MSWGMAMNKGENLLLLQTMMEATYKENLNCNYVAIYVKHRPHLSVCS